jgi:hypothetical protein
MHATSPCLIQCTERWSSSPPFVFHPSNSSFEHGQQGDGIYIPCLPCLLLVGRAFTGLFSGNAQLRSFGWGHVTDPLPSTLILHFVACCVRLERGRGGRGTWARRLFGAERCTLPFFLLSIF